MLSELNRNQKWLKAVSLGGLFSTRNPEQKARNEKPAGREQSREPCFAQVLDAWLEAGAVKHKRSTQSTYETIAWRHVRPVFGDYPVSEISLEMVSEFLRSKKYGTDRKKELSSSSVCSIVTVLRGAFRYAETMGCTVNAWGALNRPQLTTAEATVLTVPEQERLAAYLNRDREPEKLGVLICMYTGLRLGEICALKWGDISMEEGTLTVKRTVQRIRNLEYDKNERQGSRTVIVFDAPKSKRSNRSIPIPSFLLETLREQQRPDGCYVLTGKEQSFYEPRTFQNHFKTILKEAGVRELNFHALRHTFATNCINLGFDPKTLSEILGHADVSVTLNTYVHPSISRMRSYMDLLGEKSF